MKTFDIKLAELTTPREICPKMEEQGTKHYTYTFRYSSRIIKHGKAADNEWVTGTWGNRIYRQAGGIHGWDGYELDDISARKMREGMDEHFPSVDRRDVTITVYDYTDELIGKTEEEIDQRLLNEEHELVKQHLYEHGAPPNLNIQRTKTHTRPMFDNLFGSNSEDSE
jgi:hypothetical protein